MKISHLKSSRDLRAHVKALHWYFKTSWFSLNTISLLVTSQKCYVDYACIYIYIKCHIRQENSKPQFSSCFVTQKKGLISSCYCAALPLKNRSVCILFLNFDYDSRGNKPRSPKPLILQSTCKASCSAAHSPLLHILKLPLNLFTAWLSSLVFLFKLPDLPQRFCTELCALYLSEDRLQFHASKHSKSFRTSNYYIVLLVPKALSSTQ